MTRIDRSKATRKAHGTGVDRLVRGVLAALIAAVGVVLVLTSSEEGPSLARFDGLPCYVEIADQLTADTAGELSDQATMGQNPSTLRLARAEGSSIVNVTCNMSGLDKKDKFYSGHIGSKGRIVLDQTRASSAQYVIRATQGTKAWTMKLVVPKSANYETMEGTWAVVASSSKPTWVSSHWLTVRADGTATYGTGGFDVLGGDAKLKPQYEHECTWTKTATARGSQFVFTYDGGRLVVEI